MWRPWRRGRYLAFGLALAALVFAVACDEEDNGDLGDAFDETATPALGLDETATPAAGVETPTGTPSTGEQGVGVATPTGTPGVGVATPTGTAGVGVATPTGTPGVGVASPTPTSTAGAATPTPRAGAAGVQQQGMLGGLRQFVELADVTSISIDVENDEVIIVSSIEQDQAEQLCDRIEEAGLFLFGSVRFEDQDGEEVASCDVDEVTRVDVDVQTHEVTMATTWTQDEQLRAQDLCDTVSQSLLFGAIEDISFTILGDDDEELASCSVAEAGMGAATPTPTGTPGTGLGSPTPQAGQGTQQQLQDRVREHGILAALVQMIEDADVTSISLDLEEDELVIVSGIEQEQAEDLCEQVEQTGLFFLGSLRFEDEGGDEVASCDVDEVTRVDVDIETHEVMIATTWTPDEQQQAQDLCDMLSQAQVFGQLEDVTITIMGEDDEELATCGADGAGMGTPTPTSTPGAGVGTPTPTGTPGGGLGGSPTPTGTPGGGS